MSYPAPPHIQFNPSGRFDRYVELKQTLAANLTQPQWRRMAQLLNVPAGQAESFRDANDVFTWMEGHFPPLGTRPYLSRSDLSILQDLLFGADAIACAILVTAEMSLPAPAPFTSNNFPSPPVQGPAPVRVEATISNMASRTEQYQHLKRTLTQHLVRDQWSAIAELLGIPRGTRCNFRNAGDLFEWMERNTDPATGQPYLAENHINTLRRFFGSSLVSAASCLPILDKYQQTSGQVSGVSSSSSQLRSDQLASPMVSAPPVRRFPENWRQDPIRLEGDSDVGGCKICYEYRADALTQPCGHLCMCMGCARQVLTNATVPCPVCRQSVAQVLGVRLA
jgi:hypothetical protein